MAGNSQRRGAISKGKKGPKVGSGGWGKQGLEGRGPTPKAEDRTYHKAYKPKDASGAPTGGAGRGGDARRSDAGRVGAVRGGDVGRGGASGTSGRAGAPPRSGSARPGASVRRTKGTGTEIITGRNVVLEALRANAPITTIYVSSRIDMDDRVREILQTAADNRISFLEVGKPQLDRLAEGAIHQGVLAQIPPYEYLEPEDLLDLAADSGKPALIIALDGITDPHNLGAVLRSAGAFGVNGIVIPERRSAGMGVTAWRVSAGAAARVPVARATNLTRALTEFKKAGCFVVGLDGGGDADIATLAYSKDPLVLVIGAEGKGLSRLVRETCDAIAAIPISSSVESLNAAVATGITLYEVARQRAETAAE